MTVETENLTNDTPQNDGSADAQTLKAQIEELTKQLQIKDAEIQKKEAIAKEVIAQRDNLKKKVKTEQPDGEVSPELLTLQAQLKALEEKSSQLEARELKRAEKLEAKYQANVTAIPDDKRAAFAPILEQAEKMPVEERLEWLEKTLPIFTGEKAKPQIPSFNPPANGEVSTLTGEEREIARKYGWSTDKAMSFKAEDPNFFRKAVEKLRAESRS